MEHRNSLAFAIAGIIAFAPVATLAVEPAMNVRGTIVRVDGDTIDIQARGGAPAKVHLASNAKIASVAEATLSDIKPGTFIGTAATPRTDGTLQAIEVHIFPESMRGTGEGTRAWDLAPKSSMTNGTVTQKADKVENSQVSKVESNRVVVDYNGGSKVVAVTPDTKVVTLIPADRTALKPNAEIFIAGATREPDGTLAASRVTVGKDTMPPPM